MPAIAEILDRAKQGMTRPFLCRADDGRRYYVKGGEATRRELCAEWVASSLGREFVGLPVPEFQLLTVPRELIRYSMFPEIQSLDMGVVFGSCVIEDVMELGPGHRSLVPPEVAAKILVFDLWIRNDDRRMGREGGNSNLLWQPEAKKVWVFDHNLAFDNATDDTGLIQRHSFGSHAPVHDLLVDDVFKAELERQMSAGLAALPEIFSHIPSEWWFRDAEQTIDADLKLDEFEQILSRIHTDRDTFWRGLMI